MHQRLIPELPSAWTHRTFLDAFRQGEEDGTQESCQDNPSAMDLLHLWIHYKLHIDLYLSEWAYKLHGNWWKRVLCPTLLSSSHSVRLLESQVTKPFPCATWRLCGEYIIKGWTSVQVYAPHLLVTVISLIFIFKLLSDCTAAAKEPLQL